MTGRDGFELGIRLYGGWSLIQSVEYILVIINNALGYEVGRMNWTTAEYSQQTYAVFSIWSMSLGLLLLLNARTLANMAYRESTEKPVTADSADSINP